MNVKKSAWAGMLLVIALALVSKTVPIIRALTVFKSTESVIEADQCMYVREAVWTSPYSGSLFIITSDQEIADQHKNASETKGECMSHKNVYSFDVYEDKTLVGVYGSEFVSFEENRTVAWLVSESGKVYLLRPRYNTDLIINKPLPLEGYTLYVIVYPKGIHALFQKPVMTTAISFHPEMANLTETHFENEGYNGWLFVTDDESATNVTPFQIGDTVKVTREYVRVMHSDETPKPLTVIGVSGELVYVMDEFGEEDFLNYAWLRSAR